MKSLSPKNTGLDEPAPGSSIFQATFSVLLQVIGKFFSGLTPEPSGPRKRGQSAATVGNAISPMRKATKPQRTMSRSSGEKWSGASVPRSWFRENGLLVHLGGCSG